VSEEWTPKEDKVDELTKSTVKTVIKKKPTWKKKPYDKKA
jgi:hypothetical protein